MDVSTIINQLNGDKLDWKYIALTGGTMSKVYLLYQGNDISDPQDK